MLSEQPVLWDSCHSLCADHSRLEIEDIGVDIFEDQEALFDHIVNHIRATEKSCIFNINIHAANLANQYPRFKKIMQQANTMICDGMGIVWASKIMGRNALPGRFAAGDYMPALLKRLAEEQLTVYFLAGEPGVAEKAIQQLSHVIPEHTIVGFHHGYIHANPTLQKEVIADINQLKPDFLCVGFGMPLQEYWIEEHLPQLDVRAVFPMGATLDFLSQKVYRCPQWLGRLGLEWLFRLSLEPRRLFHRYVIGNPSFLSRILWARLRQNLNLPVQQPALPVSLG